MSIATKAFNKLLLNRMVAALSQLLWKNQNGFRRGRSKIAQILSIRRILEKIQQEKVIICFALLFAFARHFSRARAPVEILLNWVSQWIVQKIFQYLLN